ncbi:hypothetical protein HanRHA438_Chr08g0349771 [Helianthus annuus]|nr:hypothetical protein HanRHA438_Chr08g0349771 [Helianthus annuus]
MRYVASSHRALFKFVILIAVPTSVILQLSTVSFLLQPKLQRSGLTNSNPGRHRHPALPFTMKQYPFTPQRPGPIHLFHENAHMTDPFFPTLVRL